MTNQLTSLTPQRGSGVISIILLLIVIVIVGKLVIAILPAQVGDYQLNKTLGAQLKEANNNSETAKQFVERVNRHLSINADYDATAEEIFSFTDIKTGQLAIYKKYDKTSHFFGNVDIVNRFESEINAASVE